MMVDLSTSSTTTSAASAERTTSHRWIRAWDSTALTWSPATLFTSTNHTGRSHCHRGWTDRSGMVITTTGGWVAVLFAVDRINGWEVLRRLDPGTGEVMSENTSPSGWWRRPCLYRWICLFATRTSFGLAIRKGIGLINSLNWHQTGRLDRTLDLDGCCRPAGRPRASPRRHRLRWRLSSVPQVHLSFIEEVLSVAPGHWDLIDAWDGLWSIDGIQDLAKGESAVWGLDPDRLRIAKFHENYVNLHGIRHLPLSTNLRGLGWVDEAEEGCPEDLDGDEVVGFQDLILLLGVFDSVDPSRDLDGDGTVGMGDALRILSR